MYCSIGSKESQEKDAYEQCACQPDNIPAELQERKQWVLWRAETDKGHVTKRPCTTSGKLASTTNPADWDTFSNVLSILGYSGIGFVFTKDDPYCFIDLDDCIDPQTQEIEDWALNIIKRLNSYTERSVSGRGIHIIARAKLPQGGRRKGNFEIYDADRYCAMTGDIIQGYPTGILDRQEEVDQLYAEYFPADVQTDEKQTVGAQVLTDDDIIRIASNSKNGDKFKRLFGGDTTGYPSPSEADLALVSLLGFYTRDEEQIYRLIKRSGLYDKKWDRADYAKRTIQKALGSKQEHYKASVDYDIRIPSEQEAFKQLSARPPQNPDAELKVIGSILSPDDTEKFALRKAFELNLSTRDFYQPANQMLYAAITVLGANGQDITAVAVADYITRNERDHKQFKKYGQKDLLEYIQDAIDSTPTFLNVEYYIKTLQELSAKRLLIRKVAGMRDIVSDLYNDAVPVKSIIHKFEELVAGIAETVEPEAIPSIGDDWALLLEKLKTTQKGELLGFRTGFESLDRITHGLRGVAVIGGVPGQGKTSLALQIATEVARLNKVTVLFYALEMSKWDLYVKIISRLAELDYSTILLGSVINDRRGQGWSEEDNHKFHNAESKLKEFAGLVKVIDRSGGLINLNTIRSQVRMAPPPVFVVIDHLQLFPCDNPETDMKTRLDFLVGEFKALSERYDATILLVSEKNRQSYDKEWLGAYMGSAGIEYGADVAMLLYEEDEFKSDEDEREMTLKIVKNRFGQKADIPLTFYGKFSAFREGATK